MKTSTTTIVILALCGGAVLFSHWFFSKPKTITVPPKYDNIQSGINIGRYFGWL